MADSNPDLDLGKKKKGDGMKNILMMVIGAVLLVGLSVGLSLYLTGGNSGSVSAEEAEVEVEAEVKEEESLVSLPAIYESLEPQFVVNFVHDGVLRYLQVSMSVMTRDEAVVEQIRHHMPAIRHEVVALLSSRSYEQLGSVEGKDELRHMIRENIQHIVDPKGDKKVEEVYLTGFVMQ